MPTWRAQPLHPECDTWCEFPVADRPNAVQQWVDAAKKDPSLIKVPPAQHTPLAAGHGLLCTPPAA